MEISPGIPRIAYIVAFALAGLQILSGLIGAVVLVPFALIPLLAGIGIKRRRVWSAYGYGLFALAQLALVPVILSRAGSSKAAPQAIAIAVFAAMEAGLFLLAGKSLADTGAERGSPLPWLAVSALVVVPLLFVEPFSMPTGSMEETMLIGDRFLVHTFPAPHPMFGDIVALSYPIDHNQTFVKRIVGMPGDRIRMSKKALYRNGVQLTEPYVVHKTKYEDSYRDDFPSEPNTALFPPAQEMLLKNVVNAEVVVPPGKYFVLGDNRDYSLDSRYWGFVSSDELIGKPFLIYDSLDQSTEDLTGAQWPLKWHHTRWGRLFKSI